MNPRLALRDGFAHWLSEITSAPKIEPGIRFYPFATSRRSTAVMFPLLVQTETKQPLAVNDPTQAVRDLRIAAALVVGTYPDQTLSELGASALARWRAVGVDNNDPADEAARCAALVRSGIELGIQRYVDSFRFWCRLVELAPAQHWWSNRFALSMPAYLDRFDGQGYNPFRVLTAVNRGTIGEEAEWREWAATDPDQAFVDALTALLDRAKASHRPGGSRAFCQGMEAYRLLQTDPDSLLDTLQSWGMAE